MQSDDMLRSLAESIKLDGLQSPIVIRKVNGKDEIIDGRNRLKACKMAGVEPEFKVFEGDEEAVLRFIWNSNLRRDLKKTQRAAYAASLWPDPPKLKRKGVVTGDNISEVIMNKDADIISDNFYPHQLSKCRAVFRYSPALLADIIHDRIPLETAFVEAKEAEARSKGKDAQLARLRKEAPDLADRVDDESLTLAGALAENEERQRERQLRLQQAREAARGLWHDISVRLGTIAHGAELGEPYALPNNDRDLAESVIQRLQVFLEN